MNKKVLIVTSEITMMDDYYKIAKSNLDFVDFLLVGFNNQPKLENVFANLITCHDFNLNSILNKLKGSQYDFVVCYDEKMLGMICEIAQFVKAKTYNISKEYARDKQKLKDILVDKNINVPSYITFKTYKELLSKQNEISYPCVVKPTLSYGSNGVKLVTNWEECQRQGKNIIRINKLQETQFFDKNTAGLIEELIPGKEYAIEMIWKDYEPIAFGIMSRIHDERNDFFPDYVYFIDPNLSSDREKELYNLAKSVGEAINIQNGATHTEVRYLNEIPYVLENAIRPGGGGYLYKLFSRNQNIDFLNLYYKVMTDNHINPMECIPSVTKGFYFLYSFPNKEFGTVKEIDFLEENLSDKVTIISKEIFLKEGDKILANEYSMRYSFFIFGYTEGDKFEQFYEGVKSLDKCCKIKFI